MATSVSGTQITFPNGTTQISGTPTVIGWQYNEDSTRRSANGAVSTGTGGFLSNWTAHSYTRKRTDSAFHISGVMPGHNRYSYPYWATGLRITRPDGTQFITTRFVNYSQCAESEAVEVTYWAEVYISAADLGSSTGTFTVEYGNSRGAGSGTDGWCEIMNPNASDDDRAFQQGSTSFLEEIIYG